MTGYQSIKRESNKMLPHFDQSYFAEISSLLFFSILYVFMQQTFFKWTNLNKRGTNLFPLVIEQVNPMINKPKCRCNTYNLRFPIRYPVVHIFSTFQHHHGKDGNNSLVNHHSKNQLQQKQQQQLHVDGEIQSRPSGKRFTPYFFLCFFTRFQFGLQQKLIIWQEKTFYLLQHWF